MPFDLFIRPVGAGSFKIRAGWLERKPLPFPEACIREIWSPGYRDRYAIISLEELRAMPLFAEASPEGDDQLGELKRRTARMSDSTPLVLHWEEWESGLG